MDDGVFGAASKIRSSAAFGEIIILIVYLPILALVGIEGNMFGPMAKTVAFAILGAFILSLTYVPMMSALVLQKKTGHKVNISDRIMAFLQRIYAPVLRGALKIKVIVVSLAVSLLTAAVLLFNTLGGEFIPTLDEGDMATHLIIASWQLSLAGNRSDDQGGADPQVAVPRDQNDRHQDWFGRDSH